MYITRRDGITVEAVIMSRTDCTIRASVQGADDIQEFFNLHGTWISGDCEPVRIEFETDRIAAKRVPSEADCICAQELASQLLHLLFSAEAPLTVDAPPPNDSWTRGHGAGAVN